MNGMLLYFRNAAVICEILVKAVFQSLSRIRERMTLGMGLYGFIELKEQEHER
jgi:hypothetical protein